MRYHQRIQHDDGDDEDGASFAGRIALGHNSENDNHVMVSLAYEEKNLETRQYKLRCKVRCVNGDQWCRNDPPPRPVADVPPAYANGKIYWVVEPKLGPSSASCELVAFDSMDREFEVVQGPPCSRGGGRVSILELHGAICVAWSDRDTDAIDMWIMKDDGAWCVEHRVKLAKFSPEYSSERTMLSCIDPTDGRILLSTGRSLGYYDPKTVELETIYRTVSRSEYDDMRFRFCPVICRESLVRPFMK